MSLSVFDMDATTSSQSRKWDFHKDAMGFRLRLNDKFARVKPREGEEGNGVEYGYITEVEVDSNDASSIKTLGNNDSDAGLLHEYDNLPEMMCDADESQEMRLHFSGESDSNSDHEFHRYMQATDEAESDNHVNGGYITEEHQQLDGYVTEVQAANTSGHELNEAESDNKGIIVEVYLPRASVDSTSHLTDGYVTEAQAANTSGHELNEAVSDNHVNGGYITEEHQQLDGYVTEAQAANTSGHELNEAESDNHVNGGYITEEHQQLDGYVTEAQAANTSGDRFNEAESDNHVNGGYITEEHQQLDGYVTEAQAANTSVTKKTIKRKRIDIDVSDSACNEEAATHQQVNNKVIKKTNQRKRVNFDLRNSSSESDEETHQQTCNKRKSRIHPIRFLLKRDRCCKDKCLKTISPDAAAHARTHFDQKSLKEQAEWVLNYLTSHHQSTMGKFTYLFFVGLTNVCREAFMKVQGITRSRFYELKSAFESGVERIAERNMQKNLVNSTATERSMAWLEQFASEFGDKMPDSEKLHLPSSLTRSDVYERMRSDFDDIGFKPCSLPSFLKHWRRSYKHITIPKENRFAKCDECSKFKKALQEETNKDKRKSIQKKRDAHIKLQGAERRKYYRHIFKAKGHPDKYLSIIIDGMDQNTTAIPKPLFMSKFFSSIWKVVCHVVGVIVHGQGIHMYVDVGEIPSDSSATCNILLQTILKYADKLPPVLYLQMDNCGRENKNKFVFGLCCLLVELDIFKKIKVNFLPVGHTHEDIDQLFSRVSVHLSKFHVCTFSRLLALLQASCKKMQTTAERFTNYFCIREWILPHLNEMQQHSVPHSFKFTKEEGTGKAKIQTRKWASIKTEWQNADHDDTTAPYLLKNHPEGYPERLLPELSGLKLDTVKKDLRRGVVKGFVKEEEFNEWTTFIQTLEDEARNGVEEGDFPLYDIMPYMNDCGKGKETALSEAHSESTSCESDHLALVHLGRKKREAPQMPPKKDWMIAVYCNNTNYQFSWPQIGKVVEIMEDKILLHWYSGGGDHQCTALSLPNQHKKIPWIEEVLIEDVISSPFNLTKKKILPLKIQKFLTKKFKDYFE